MCSLPASLAMIGMFLSQVVATPTIRSFSRLEGDDGPVQCVTFSPDGRMVASGGDRFVQLFDWQTGRRLQRLTAHGEKVRCVTFSPDGKLLASGGDDKTISIWEADGGKQVLSLKTGLHFPADFPVRCVAFLPDGKTLASCGTDNFVTFWDVERAHWERKSWTNHADSGGLVYLAFSPDGKRCAVAGGVSPRLFAKQATLYDLSNGLKWRSDHAHTGDEGATHVCFSADGTKIITCGHDNSARVWNVANGTLLQVLAGPDGNRVMQASYFTPDSRHAITVTRAGTIQVWTATDGLPLASAAVSNHPILAFTVSPDGRLCATGCEDGAVHLWRVENLPTVDESQNVKRK